MMDETMGVNNLVEVIRMQKESIKDLKEGNEAQARTNWALLKARHRQIEDQAESLWAMVASKWATSAEKHEKDPTGMIGFHVSNEFLGWLQGMTNAFQALEMYQDGEDCYQLQLIWIERCHVVAMEGNT